MHARDFLPYLDRALAEARQTHVDAVINGNHVHTLEKYREQVAAIHAFDRTRRIAHEELKRVLREPDDLEDKQP